MLLEEWLFCVVFIILPLVGMVGAGIKKALKALNREWEEQEEKAAKEAGKQVRKEGRGIPLKMFFKGVRGEKNLKEEGIHLGILTLQRNIRTHQRAGP